MSKVISIKEKSANRVIIYCNSQTFEINKIERIGKDIPDIWYVIGTGIEKFFDTKEDALNYAFKYI